MGPDIINLFALYKTHVPSSIVSIYEFIYWTWDISNHESYMELKGIHDAIDDPELTLSTMVMVNTMYELESYCTSIIAKMSNGTIIHQRNMDFDGADLLRKASFNANFVKNGSVVFQGTLFAGTIGVYTGIK
jgi:hypothetical protein